MSLKDPPYAALRRFWAGLPAFPLAPRETALLVMDVQYLTCHPEFGIGRRMKEGRLRDLARWYFTEVERVVDNVARIRDTCREAGMQVAYSYLAAATEDARDVSRLVRHHGLYAEKGSGEGRILAELSPGQHDLVVPRTTLSFFTPWHGDQLLRNSGVSTLIVAGVLTDGSIASTARDAGDRGYRTVVVEDACAALVADDHRAALEPIDLWYGHVVTTDELLRAIRRGEDVS